jgi:hypothetical protein
MRRSSAPIWSSYWEDRLSEPVPAFTQFFSLLREQIDATRWRTDVLRPLTWLVITLSSTLVATLAAKAPNWLPVTLTIVLIFAVVLYAGAYVFCLLKDRDALRSEKYSLNKLAIERGLLGDSDTGLIDVGDQMTQKLLEGAPMEKSAEDKSQKFLEGTLIEKSAEDK